MTYGFRATPPLAQANSVYWRERTMQPSNCLFKYSAIGEPVTFTSISIVTSLAISLAIDAGMPNVSTVPSSALSFSHGGRFSYISAHKYIAFSIFPETAIFVSNAVSTVAFLLNIRFTTFPIFLMISPTIKCHHRPFLSIS